MASRVTRTTGNLGLDREIDNLYKSIAALKTGEGVSSPVPAPAPSPPAVQQVPPLSGVYVKNNGSDVGLEAALNLIPSANILLTATDDSTNEQVSVTPDLSTTGVTAGTYGDSTHVPQLTVDNKGRISAVSNVAVSGGGGGSNTPSWTKITKSYSDLAAASSTNDIEVLSLPAKSAIHAAVIRHSILFDINGYTLSIGLSGNLTKYAPAFNVHQAVGNTVFQFSQIQGIENWGATTSIRLAASCSNLVVDDNFNRANTTTGGAGSTTGVGNGWIDIAGSIGSIASNQCLTADPASNNDRLIARPASENAIDQKIIVDLGPSSPTGVNCNLRVSAAGNTGYECLYDIAGGHLQIYTEISGTFVNLRSVSTSAGFNSTHSYEITFQAVGSSPTTLSATLTDLTTSTVIGTITSFTDNTSGLQIAGSYGFSSYYTANWTRVRTYTPTTAPLLNTATQGSVDIELLTSALV